MNTFFDEYFRFVDRIEDQYPTPNSVNFRERKFEVVKWTKPEHRNFFTILKVLAESGASTIDEIVECDGKAHHAKTEKSRYTSYRRIILGDAKIHVNGLIEKGVVTQAKADNKKEKKYELTLFGVFYAIRLFMDLEIIASGNYQGILRMDTKVGGYDYGDQIKFPSTIIDDVAKNYPHLLPMIFGKWDYLKNNPRIDVYQLFDLANMQRNSNILLNNRISVNTIYSADFARYDQNITMTFYSHQIERAYYSIKHFLKSMDDEIKELIDKLFYCYERMHRENYYRSQAHYFLYKGEKEKALANTIKAIKCNDLLDAKTKKRFLEGDIEELDHYGIDFA